jgi:multicomponent K+:H+ antiporter subunit G
MTTMFDELHLAWQVAIAAMLVAGGVFALVGAVGLVRFPDFYMRLHAPTKATTLGIGGVLLASLIAKAALGNFGLHELLITGFVFITAPVSASLLAQAALHLRALSRAEVPPEQPEP